MGLSSAPTGGYDKKTMSEDIYQLLRSLGYQKANIVGHDIGAMVAFSFAANHPAAATKLVLLDVPHPDESWNDFKMLPEEGKFGDKVDASHPPYPWWFAFHQVTGLDEKLLAGNGMREYIAWLFGYLLEDNSKIEPIDLAVYSDIYSSPDRIRAGHDLMNPLICHAPWIWLISVPHQRHRDDVERVWERWSVLASALSSSGAI